MSTCPRDTRQQVATGWQTARGSRVLPGAGQCEVPSSDRRRSHRPPRQFEILPSVEHEGQSQVTAPSIAMVASTGALRHLKQVGASPGRVVAEITAPMNSANFRAAPLSGAIAPFALS